MFCAKFEIASKILHWRSPKRGFQRLDGKNRGDELVRHSRFGTNLWLALSLSLATAAPVSLLAQNLPPDGTTVPTIALTGAPAIQEPAPNPPDQQSQWNTELAGFSDLQGRSAYQPIIVNENGREIAYVGHHTGSAMNPLTGVVEPNGTSIVDVTDPAKHKVPGSYSGLNGSRRRGGRRSDGARVQREPFATCECAGSGICCGRSDPRHRKFMTSRTRPTPLA